MSLYLDLKYINLISNRLPLFKKKNNNLFNFRCVLCGDSETKKNKTRGYFYQVPHKNEMSMKCHNCAASMYFGSFLQQFDPLLHKEYLLEKFKETGTQKPVKVIPKEMDFKVPESKFSRITTNTTLLDNLLDRLDTLPDDNEAVQFCLKRMIPREVFDRLYYIDDMKKMGGLSDKYLNKIETSEPRLVIPIYDFRGAFEGVTCRALRGESLRYVALRVKEDGMMIFGAERLNTKNKVYAVEGPIDSLFVKNAIAVGGVSFGRISSLHIPKDNLTIILDNQPRNKDVCRQYKKYIDAGFKIMIWPQAVDEKDINDLVLAGMAVNKLNSFIDKNTFRDLEAQLKFLSWKRV